MIVGFSGKAAAGKTTAAHCMAELLPGEVKIIPMAQVLRTEVADFLGAAGAKAYIPLVYGCQQDKVRVFHIDAELAASACPRWGAFVDEHADIQDRKDLTAVTIRRLLQWWGTEYRRADDPDYWTKAWARTVAGHDLERTHILIDDIRFVNELETVLKLGGLIVKIERPGFDGAGNHSSETSLDHYADWHSVIVNAGSLDQFYHQVAELTEQLLDGGE